MQALDALIARAIGATVVRSKPEAWNMLTTLESTGSVVTTLSVMGTTVVKGR